ncbi:MAG: sulfatase-like hydrolase/transferase, partial [Pseudomonadales bacterium]|nr:sulfatase-like hydrolase/transferase [Pseudomonadales bacterium]
MNAYVLLSPRQALIAWLRVILLMLVIFALSRLSLILTNGDLWPSAPVTDWLASFSMGLRFDLRMAVYGSLPMVFLPLVPFVWYQRFCGLWVSLFTLAYVFSGVLEIEFYGEFQQRLNGLVLQYIKEDPETVLRMVWEGLPVFRYTLLFVVISAFFIWLIRRIFNQPRLSARPGLLSRLGVFLLIFVLATVWARGSLRSGPPLRWGDAFVTDHTFLNHLALNGSFTLAKAMMNFAARDQTGAWIRLEDQAAADTTRSMLALPPAAESRRARENLEVVNEPNVVVIILESFSGQYTGALGNPLGVTPAFDALAEQGLLFTRAFSNGTHTHQGIFATLSCFPNLPGYEYLMQQPE